MDADASGSLDMNDLREIAANRGMKRILSKRASNVLERDGRGPAEYTPAATASSVDKPPAVAPQQGSLL